MTALPFRHQSFLARRSRRRHATPVDADSSGIAVETEGVNDVTLIRAGMILLFSAGVIFGAASSFRSYGCRLEAAERLDLGPCPGGLLPFL
jgi:hypothetical protein